jgi:hypothetical protein
MKIAWQLLAHFCKSLIAVSSVGGELRLKPVKTLLRLPRINRGLYHQRWHRTDDHRFCPSAFAEARRLAHYFTAVGTTTIVDRHLLSDRDVGGGLDS